RDARFLFNDPPCQGLRNHHVLADEPSGEYKGAKRYSRYRGTSPPGPSPRSTQTEDAASDRGRTEHQTECRVCRYRRHPDQSEDQRRRRGVMKQGWRVGLTHDDAAWRVRMRTRTSKAIAW